MSNYSHKHEHGCEHDRLAYCKHCDVVYCKDCNREWPSVKYNYWPYYWPNWYTQPYYYGGQNSYTIRSQSNTAVPLTATGSVTAMKSGDQITYTNHSNCGG